MQSLCSNPLIRFSCLIRNCLCFSRNCIRFLMQQSNCLWRFSLSFSPFIASLCYIVPIHYSIYYVFGLHSFRSRTRLVGWFVAHCFCMRHSDTRKMIWTKSTKRFTFKFVICLSLSFLRSHRSHRQKQLRSSVISFSRESPQSIETRSMHLLETEYSFAAAHWNRIMIDRLAMTQHNAKPS